MQSTALLRFLIKSNSFCRAVSTGVNWKCGSGVLSLNLKTSSQSQDFKSVSRLQVSLMTSSQSQDFKSVSRLQVSLKTSSQSQDFKSVSRLQVSLKTSSQSQDFKSVSRLQISLKFHMQPLMIVVLEKKYCYFTLDYNIVQVC